MVQNSSKADRTAGGAAQFGSSTCGGRWIRNTAILLGLLLSPCTFQLARAAAERGQEAAPMEFSVAACYQLVRNAGRQIAWARWEREFPVERTRAAVLREATTEWTIELEQKWISDAYEWRASDEQIRQWAAELGSVEDLPSAEQLSVHESIAIWLRRIGRECGERVARTDKTANAIRDELYLPR